MNKKIIKDFFIFIILILFSLVSIFVFIRFIERARGTSKSHINPGIRIENSLGKLLRLQLLMDTKIAELAVTQEALTTMSNFLMQDKPSFPFDIEIILIDSNIINALALPGGTLIIYSGLIKAADDPREVMAVLAHEMAHVFYRDAYKSIIRSVGLSVVITALTGGNSEIISTVIDKLLSMSYSREVESRADDYALELLAFQGIDPEYMASFFQKLEEIYNRKDEKSAILHYFSTHPATSERIEKAHKASLIFSDIKKQPDIDWAAVRQEQSSFFN